MKETLEQTIKDMATEASKACTAIEAMQYTQAALNAANALITISNIGKI